MVVERGRGEVDQRHALLQLSSDWINVLGASNGSMVYAMAFGMLTFPEHALLLFLVSAAGSGVALAILAFKARSSMETGMSFVDIELLVRLTGVMLLTMGFVLIACIKLF